MPVVLAVKDPEPKDKGGQGEDFGKSSPVGLLLLIVFFVAVIFLIRSMTKHLKRVPASFDPPEDDAPAAEASAEATAEASAVAASSATSDAPEPDGGPKKEA
ncbi:hypothetical protein F0L68_10465 [Solihabitans fulvus]|uniref:Preprotein translocase subunit SecG n=1 Tax=Solihabitans fulvus TaxID=1892852 RepID=A0A5B2XHE5_9PSEU|nr:hypothetical protein [Solihabitans fulvus]KAA2263278.1 hypothetical protein F0L68_10465 [Solihabitans fulvus]